MGTYSVWQIKLKKDFIVAFGFFLFSIFLITLTINVIPLTNLEKIITFTLGTTYGIFTAFLFLSGSYQCEIWSKTQNLKLREKLNRSIPHVYAGFKLIVLYVIIVGVIMTYMTFFIRRISLPFVYSFLPFIAGAFFGASIYSIWNIRKEIRKSL